MNIKKKNGKGVWAAPLLLALPLLALLAAAVIRYGPALVRLINVMIKAAVTA